MNAKDMIHLVEYFDKMRKPEKTKRRMNDNMDFASLAKKKIEEAEATLKFFKDFEKLNKKDEKDKKPEMHKLTFAEGMLLAIMAQFVLGPLYKVFLVHLGVQ